MKFVILFFLLGFITPGFGAEKVPFGGANAEMLLGFADHLFEQGELYRAITEYQRFVFMYPEHEKYSHAWFQMSRVYHLGGMTGEARDAARELEYRLPESGEARFVPLLMAATYRKESRPGLAAMQLEVFAAQHPDAREGQLASLLAGLEFLRADEPAAAREIYQEFPMDSDLRGTAEDLYDAIDRYEALPLKRPWLAGTLSAVLPGAGQLYVGNRSDALVSFLLNGVLFYATYEAFDREQYAAGLLLGSIGIGWYSGNIYNAVNGAHKANHRERQRFLERLDLTIAPLWMRDEPALSLGALYRF